MHRKVLIMGLPSAGKTTLANTGAPLRNAVVFNADAVRANLSRDLGFSHDDRVEHACRMGWMCDRVVESGGTVIVFYGRDGGYTVERITLDETTESIYATQVRALGTAP